MYTTIDYETTMVAVRSGSNDTVWVSHTIFYYEEDMKKISIFITLSQKKWREILPAYGDPKDSRPDHHYNIMIINSIQTIPEQNHPMSLKKVVQICRT